MSTSKVLSLRFKTADGKKHNIRIKNADSSVSKDMVQQLADQIVKDKAFDFDGKQSAYTFDSATYTTTQKNALIAASSNK